MKLKRAAAIVYATLTAGLIAFQVALAAGAPWGELAMGGSNPGVYPLPLRIAAIVQAALVGFFALVVLARAGVALPKWERMSRKAIWVAVAFAVIGLVLNVITPSVRERMLWAPFAAVQLGAILIVALGKDAPQD
jgi:hypothetical protein